MNAPSALFVMSVTFSILEAESCSYFCSGLLGSGLMTIPIHRCPCWNAGVWSFCSLHCVLGGGENGGGVAQPIMKEGLFTARPLFSACSSFN